MNRKIFCTGLSRTGTTALCHGLESLGLKVVHYPIHLFIQTELIGLNPLEQKLPLAKYQQWRFRKEMNASYHAHNANQLLNSHQCFADLPIPLLYQQLDQLFPGSLFIHTTRDVDKWLGSMKWLYESAGPLWRRGFVDDELLYQMYGSSRFNEQLLKVSFLNHEESVQAFLAQKNGQGLTIHIDKGELTYATLGQFIKIPSGLTGDLPRLNEPKSPSVIRKLNHFIERRYLPLNAFTRTFKRVLSIPKS